MSRTDKLVKLLNWHNFNENDIQKLSKIYDYLIYLNIENFIPPPVPEEIPEQFRNYLKRKGRAFSNMTKRNLGKWSPFGGSFKKYRKTKTYKWYSSSVKNARRNSRRKKRYSSKIYK